MLVIHSQPTEKGIVRAKRGKKNCTAIQHMAARRIADQPGCVESLSFHGFNLSFEATPFCWRLIFLCFLLLLLLEKPLLSSSGWEEQGGPFPCFFLCISTYGRSCCQLFFIILIWVMHFFLFFAKPYKVACAAVIYLWMAISWARGRDLLRFYYSIKPCINLLVSRTQHIQAG